MRCRLFILYLLAAAIPHANSKVYDCFLFLNEVEVLDIRLHEMAPVVDKFVIVEAIETFRGNPKELVFAKFADSFKEFADKIIYIPIDHHFESECAWRREKYHRNMIIKGLEECEENDVILISDVDEIVSAKSVKEIVVALRGKQNLVVAVNQKLHSFFLNRVPDGALWRGTVATSFNKLKRLTCDGTRLLRYDVPGVGNGWHFTNHGGLERYLYKLGAYSHSEWDTPEYKEAKREESPVWRTSSVPVDESFPLYIRENQSYFEEIGFLLRCPSIDQQ